MDCAQKRKGYTGTRNSLHSHLNLYEPLARTDVPFGLGPVPYRHQTRHPKRTASQGHTGYGVRWRSHVAQRALGGHLKSFVYLTKHSETCKAESLCTNVPSRNHRQIYALRSRKIWHPIDMRPMRPGDDIFGYR